MGKAKKDSPALAAVEQMIRRQGPWGPGTPQHYFFRPYRQWRFDLAWPDLLVAFECEGGVWTGGRHTRGSGYSGDCEKYSVAAGLGWCVIRATVQQINTGLGMLWLESALRSRFGLKPLPGFGLLAKTRSRARVGRTARRRTLSTGATK
jgi:hypothetical protein